MKDKLKKLEPDIRNIIYRGIAKYFPDSKISLIDDVSEEVIDYILYRLEKETKFTERTVIFDEFVGQIDITKCCKVGPIQYDKYCANCGKKIINPNTRD